MNRKALAAVVLIIIGLGAAWQLRLFNRPPTVDFAYRTATRTLQYIAPTDEDTITFTSTSSDPDNDELSYSWFVDSKLASYDRDYSTKLSAGNHTVKLMVSDGRAEGTLEKIVTVERSWLHSKKALRIPIKGIVYLVGRQFLYPPPFRDELEIREHMDVIKDELGCNSIKIYGDYEDWLVRCAEIAIEKEFPVIALAPLYRMMSKTEEISVEENTRRVIEFSKKAERLREKCSAISMIVACELSLEAKGIREGATYLDRQKEIDPEWGSQEIFSKLNYHLRRMVSGVRENFHGKITYGKLGGGDKGGGAENVDWNDLGFDVVGAQEYWPKRWFSREQMIKSLVDLKAYGKPVWITEFGSCTYENASIYGGAGGDNYLGRKYDEEEQATGIEDSIELYRETEMDAIFLHAFTAGYWNNNGFFYGIARGRPDLPSTRKLGFYMYKSYLLSGSSETRQLSIPSSVPPPTQLSHAQTRPQTNLVSYCLLMGTPLNDGQRLPFRRRSGGKVT